MDNITMQLNLDLSKIKKGFDFTTFDKAIKRGLKNGIDTLRIQMEEQLLKRLGKYGLADSSFVGDIRVVNTGNGILMEIDSEYAFYVEYGTGIVGSESPHPNPSSSQFQGYDLNNHGDKGWYYPKDGGFYWTKGQPAKPFMYETWLWCRGQATRIVRDKIRQEIQREIQKQIGR